MSGSPPSKGRRERAARAYVWCVAALGAASAAAWALLFGFPLTPATLAAGLALAALCAAARFLPVGFGVGKASFDAGGVPIFAALVLGGPACALLAAAPSAAHRDPSRAAFMAAVHALQIFAGSLAFSLLAPGPLLLSGPAAGAGTAAAGTAPFSAPLAWGTLAAGLAFFGLDAVVGPLLMRLKYGLSWREVLEEVVLPALPSDALAVVATLAAALAAASFGPAAAPALLLGGALSVAAANLVRGQRKKALRLEAEVAALRDALSSSNLEFASRLVERLGSRDGRAAALSAASSVYAYDVAREMALPEGRAREVRLAALLMDVGLLWVPDEVLLTPPEKLNSVGRMRLEGHPASAEAVLAAVPGLGPEAARWARWHHERPDGSGYPDRLKGEWIPVEAKILAVASLYASLVLDGPRRPGLAPGEARRELVGGMGGSVDAAAARAMLVVLGSEDAAYASASDARFSFPHLPSPGPGPRGGADGRALGPVADRGGPPAPSSGAPRR